MTKLEAVGAPVVFRGRWGEVRLIPGHPVDLPDDRAARLLSKAPGRVRAVGTAQSERVDLTGHIVEWNSPLFCGEMRATVLEDLGHGVRVLHPMTEVECVIPTTWLCRQ
jgi:hypothetical protein